MKRHSGVLVVLGLFAFGGLVLCGLFLAPRVHSPPAPAEAAFGVPARSLRIVSFNILHNQRGMARVVDEIKKLNPDFVLLQEVESADVVAMATDLGMQQNYQPKLYQASVNLAGPRSSWGNCILAKHPMYESDSIPNPGGGSFGVWGVAVVDGKKFLVADVHLSATWKLDPIQVKESGVARSKEISNLRDAWHARGSPPIIVGGDFNQIPLGNNYAAMQQEWTDALAKLGRIQTTFQSGLLKTRIDYFLMSKDWTATDGGVVESEASDHRAIWMEMGRK